MDCKIDDKGSEIVDGKIVIEGSNTDDSKTVIDGSEYVNDSVVPRGSDMDDGRTVEDDIRPVSVTGGSTLAVELSITGAIADKLVIGDNTPVTDRLGSEETGFVSMIGVPSGPIFTARLANMTTVLVPLRREPVGGSPKPCVNVHKPSE